MILTEVNSTFVTLAMDTWLSGGCPVESFDVALKVTRDTVWHTVENSIPGNVVSISLLTYYYCPYIAVPYMLLRTFIINIYNRLALQLYTYRPTTSFSTFLLAQIVFIKFEWYTG